MDVHIVCLMIIINEEHSTEKYRTQWAAQFLIAGELSRQGHKVAMLIGNAPRTDILVESASR
jgi:hypothetical protein